MTGGGFGGCVIALVPPTQWPPSPTRCANRRRAGYPAPTITHTRAGAGAALVR